MEHVPALRARIEALSSEITRTKINFQKKKGYKENSMELLRKFERDKSLVQRRLNSLLDPVVRLPFEISSEIFLQSLSSIPEKPGAHTVPMLLLNVCNTWADIARSTPALWAAIRIACPCAEGSEERWRAWLQRAHTRPLSVSISGKLRDGDVPAFVWEYGGQIKHLEICEARELDEDDSDTESYLAAGIINIDLFGARHPGSLLLLETLTIRGSGHYQEEFYAQQILELLGLAPNLQECTFRDMRPVSERGIESTMLFLPALHHVMFGERAERPHSSDSILKFVTLPGLQTLRTSLGYLSGDDLLSLLRRSSPPLKELALGDGFFRLGSVALFECFHLVPTLEHFAIWRWASEVLDELAAALIASPSLLPNLHTLRIANLFETGGITFDSCLKTLLRALSIRPKIRNVRVELADVRGDSVEPAAEILAVFRELVKDGLQVHIGWFSGSSNTNFLRV
ncbi:hypothetical protein DFH06DRAFT_293736 [Mycena polygramma]|nr:hypothetical protein DFH06DRAFT_293736 [Mycena polygramma]